LTRTELSLPSSRHVGLGFSEWARSWLCCVSVAEAMLMPCALALDS